MTGSQLLEGTSLAGAQVALAVQARHGDVSVQPDGSFTYVPRAGFIGRDSFWIVEVSVSSPRPAFEVVIDVLAVGSSPTPEPTPSPQPSPSPTPEPSPAGDAFLIGSTSGGESPPGVEFGSLGPLDFAFDWLIPGFALTLPGLLVVVLVLVQTTVGVAWLPLVRRDIGDFGLRSPGGKGRRTS